MKLKARLVRLDARQARLGKDVYAAPKAEIQAELALLNDLVATSRKQGQYHAKES